ncbi:D-alanyl-D-alanine endopeptidase [Pelomicrobium methylotrophicum]|uniref:D-alanyl-D-alanine endopeptidase n=1 Tax=Pelomicrobium methylotrophicum TaxID=2602750 RepID=A0A5C7END0_9PROT|nr:D-alanyl-D-alanine endopeptidase [Pelomicrobium methylotrophicum]TXF13069.1 D-alanyl-D-alanine endopeptidase [Pelomicrobium methylotrophicum]
MGRVPAWVLAMLMIGAAQAQDHGALQEKASRTSAKTPVNLVLRTAASSRADVDGPQLKSAAALVLDSESGAELYAKNSTEVMPIASITKLMTAMVVLDARLPLDELIAIDAADVDTLKHSGSRLRVGTVLPRRELLRLALMASENRAAAALARTYPGGTRAFVRTMNVKAKLIGMAHTEFVEPTGLDSRNVSTARDLAKLVEAAAGYDLIRQFTTTPQARIKIPGTQRTMAFSNSNRLVAHKDWEIDVSKTGFIREAGRCLVMQARVAGRRVIIVLLDSWGKLTRIGDANRIKRWMESSSRALAVSG